MGGPYPPYPDGPFARKFAIGGAGGSNFLALPKDKSGELSGAVVKKLSLWKTKDALVGIRVWYSDGTFSALFGREKGTETSFTFIPGEQVTSLTIWGNGIGTRAGRLFFTTNKDKTFDCGKDTSGQSSYPAPPESIGSGLMMGVFGRSGSEIDCFGFIFLDKIKRIVISNVRYDIPDLQTQGISPKFLQRARYQYHGLESTWTFAGTLKLVDTTTFSQSATLSYGQSVTIEAGIPEIVKVGSTAGWNISGTLSQESSSTNEHGAEWQLSGVLKSPADDVECTAVCWYGTLSNIPYAATVTVYFKSGKEFSYEETGCLTRTQYTLVESNATPLNLPKGAVGVSNIVYTEEDALLN